MIEFKCNFKMMLVYRSADGAILGFSGAPSRKRTAVHSRGDKIVTP